jgi:carboxypeptidase family protein/dockerin type I repeat protein
MRRIPLYLITAICGLLFFAIGIMTIMAVDFQSPQQLVPTVVAMLGQMSPQEVIDQLGQKGKAFSPEALATAQAMLQQGIPAEQVIDTVISASRRRDNTDTQGHDELHQPTGILATVVVPVQPPVGDTPLAPIVIPVLPTPEGIVPLPTAVGENPLLTAGVVLPLPTLEDSTPQPATVGATSEIPQAAASEELSAQVEVGNISGAVAYDDGRRGAGINLTLTRPDSSNLRVPVSADGTFTFNGMESGAYTLTARAAGYLSAQAVFTLDAGQNLVLSAVSLTAGDTNGDDVVDLLDAALIASNFGSSAVVAQADLNHDGQIDVRDLTIIGKRFGTAGPLTWN